MALAWRSVNSIGGCEPMASERDNNSRQRDAVAETIEGYAAVFNQETVIAGLFREVIKPGAFRETIIRDDVRASFNHNLDQLLGRKAAGTLKLSEDTRGLRSTITLNEKDPIAMGVAAKIARRDVTGSSFWFEPVSDDDEQSERGASGQLPLRTLLKVKLIEAGRVALPAYGSTTVVSVSDARSPEALERLRSAKAALGAAKRRRV